MSAPVHDNCPLLWWHITAICWATLPALSSLHNNEHCLLTKNYVIKKNLKCLSTGLKIFFSQQNWYQTTNFDNVLWYTYMIIIPCKFQLIIFVFIRNISNDLFGDVIFYYSIQELFIKLQMHIINDKRKTFHVNMFHSLRHYIKSKCRNLLRNLYFYTHKKYDWWCYAFKFE